MSSKPQLLPWITRQAADLPEWAQARRGRWAIAVALFAVLVSALLSVGAGSVAIPPLVTIKILLAQLPFVNLPIDWSPTFETILLDIRLPRVALIALTGAALSSAGTAYQGLFRNPLADPYLIGVSAGAGLGAVSAMALQAVYPALPLLLVPACAFAGALLTVALVYAFGRVGRSTPATTLVLAGVALGALASALTTFVLLSMKTQVARVLTFLLGGYGSGGWMAVLLVLPCCLLSYAILALYARPLNLMLCDETQARQLGVAVERVKLAVVIAATLSSAAAVAFSGLIGFVGLIVPHIARLLVGGDQRRLLPIATLGGAAFLMLSDLLARTVLAPEELPLGVVTACAGAPFFLYLLRQARRKVFF